MNNLIFFNFRSIIFIVLGVGLICFAKTITNALFRLPPEHKFNKPIFRSLLYIWPTRGMGIICLVFAFLFSISGPPQGFMKRDKNRLILLEDGTITKGTVTKSCYDSLAPAGWKIIYQFNVNEPKTGEEKTYWGSATGPKKYYKNLSAGDPITVIYYPPKPKINCEIKYFLNHPGYRDAFKDADKLPLLDRFKEEYKIEDYSFREWYELTQQR